MRNRLIFLILCILFSFCLFSLSINIRSFDHQNYTRLVFEGDNSFGFKINNFKNSIEIEIDKIANIKNRITRIDDSKLIDRVAHSTKDNKSTLTVYFKSKFKIKRNFVLEKPYRVVFDIVKSEGLDKSLNPSEDKNFKLGQKESNIKNEPLKNNKPPKKNVIETICIDPGHGGSDLGAVGRSKLMEKDITLKVSRKLKKLIESKLGLRVITTRDKDVEVSLDSRAAMANNQKAQIFVSIHVNSSFRESARGPETYYVSLKATDQEAFKLAEKENSSFGEALKIAENDDLKMILWNMAQTEYIKESSKLASFIQSELNILMHTKNRGVKQAPFRVLMRAGMPAVLIEIAFISNFYEEKSLMDDSFLDKVANAIYTGISKSIYFYNNK
jgi:N-acetylmuramoyl-L-alanine amidase